MSNIEYQIQNWSFLSHRLNFRFKYPQLQQYNINSSPSSSPTFYEENKTGLRDLPPPPTPPLSCLVSAVRNSADFFFLYILYMYISIHQHTRIFQVEEFIWRLLASNRNNRSLSSELLFLFFVVVFVVIFVFIFVIGFWHTYW